MFLCQVKELTDTVTTISDGRGDTFVAGFMLLLGAGLLVFWSYRDRKESAERAAEQEKERIAADRRREEEDRKRIDTQFMFHREISTRNADQLDVACDALDRTSKCMEILTRSVEATEAIVVDISHQQRRDRSAISAMIDATECHASGDHDLAKKSIRDARNHLIHDTDS